jgi:CRISPR-associated protein Csx17
MNYLKALGVLRLVSEQADPEARGCWRNDVFVLQGKLDLDAALHFFVDHYQPTPILAPWNAGSGFYRKWDPAKRQFKARDVAEALDAVATSTSARLRSYRALVQSTKIALAELGRPIKLPAVLRKFEAQGKREKWSTTKTKDAVKKFFDSSLLFEVNGRPVCLGKADKDEFLKQLRSEVLDDKALGWLDAAIVLLTGQKKNRKEAPALGSGGNIGNSDFSSRFMELLPTVMALAEGADLPSRSIQYLKASLWAEPASELLDFSVDQFDPGRAGSANMGQGLIAEPSLNPWDYILMVEGSLLLGGAAARRLCASKQAAAFPFCPASSSVGFPSAGDDETRGELWLPLWGRFCSLAELNALFGEGRGEVGSRPARTGVDFARAACSLGIDRGITAFVRWEFQKRLGDSYLANSLGRFPVRQQQSADLLRQVDPWLDRFRNACDGKNVPPRFKTALREIEQAIFDFCRYGGPAFFQAILSALGRAERELCNGERFRTDKRLSPIAGLSPDWIAAANDGTPEFELALALAGVSDPERKIGPLRANLEPVVVWPDKSGALAAKWAEKDRAVVWNSANLSVNLTRVLARRMMDGDKQGCENLPLASGTFVSLSTVSQFLAGQLDDRRIEDLLWGLILVEQKTGLYAGQLADADAPPLPRAFPLLKLLFLPQPLHIDAQPLRVKPEPELVTLLAAGRIGKACRIAMRRLRASGLAPLPHPPSGGTARDADWMELDHLKADGHRLAASLLLPISRASVDELCLVVVRKTEAGPRKS